MKTRIGPSLLRISTPRKESPKSNCLQTQESPRNPTGLPQSKRVLLVRIRSGKRRLRGNSDAPFAGGSLGRLGASELTFHITGIPLNFNNLFFTINPLLSGQINKLQGEKKTIEQIQTRLSRKQSTHEQMTLDLMTYGTHDT